MDNITKMKKTIFLLLPLLTSCGHYIPGPPRLSMDKEKLTTLFTNVKSIDDKLAYQVHVDEYAINIDARFYEDKNKNIIGQVSDVEACFYTPDGEFYTDQYYVNYPTSDMKPSLHLEKNLSVEQIANLMFERNEVKIVMSSKNLLPVAEDLLLTNKDKWRVCTEYPIKSICVDLTADEFENCAWTMKDTFISLIGGEEEYKKWYDETFRTVSGKRLKGDFAISVSDGDDRLYPSISFGDIVLHYWE